MIFPMNFPNFPMIFPSFSYPRRGFHRVRPSTRRLRGHRVADGRHRAAARGRGAVRLAGAEDFLQRARLASRFIVVLSENYRKSIIYRISIGNL